MFTCMRMNVDRAAGMRACGGVLLQDDISKNAYGTFHVDRNRIQCSQKFYSILVSLSLSLSHACTYTHWTSSFTLLIKTLFLLASWIIKNLHTHTTLYIYINLLFKNFLPWVCSGETPNARRAWEERRKKKETEKVSVCHWCLAAISCIAL